MYKAVLGAICCLSFALSLHAQSPQEKGLQSISRTSAEAIVGFLADDELQGREAGMHGSRLAARYLASCLKEAGIAPLEKDNYYQPFEAYNKERQQRGRWQVHPDSIAILEQGVHRILQMSNVLGTIPGERPDEYVIVGAHFDHLGVDETLANDRIYNGEDDNASGVSAVLQISCHRTEASAHGHLCLLGWGRKGIARLQILCTKLSFHQPGERLSQFRHDRP